MATNPFDQFDAPAANPFDQFDAAPVATGGIPGPRRSWSDVAKEAYTNAPSSLKNLYVGMAQAITSPVQTAQGLLDVGAGALQNITPTIVRDFINQFDTNPAAAKRAVEAANAVGGEYAKRYGSIEGFKEALATDPASVAADFSTLMTGGAAATARAAPAVSKVAATAGRLTNPLAPVGVAVNVAKYPLGAVGNVAEAMFNPKNALYMRAAEGQGPEIVNALRAAQEIVPGSIPTAAQAAADTGVVGFQKMGKSAAGVLETEYKGREAAQKAALRGAVQEVGKTLEDVAAAEKARASVTSPMYKAADQTLSKVDSEFTSLLQRPSMDQVMARAARLAAERDIPFQIGKTVPEQRVPSALVDEAGRPLAETVTPATFAQLPGTSIHFIKQAFDDLTKDPATFGIGAAEARAIGKTRNEFLTWAEQTEKNPAYKQARETFAKMSEPINQMQVGQFLESKLTPALGEETARLRATGYATALEQAPQTIKKATGETRYATLEEMFKSDPEALKSLHAVRDDLARQAKSEALARGPIKKEMDVTRAAEAIAGETALPNMINRVTTVANDIWRRLRGRIDQSVAIEVAQEMLFPGKAADALEAAMRQQARRQAVATAAAAPARAAYVTPAIANMLAPQQQNQNALAR
jgi:hypothetical protein